MANKLDMNYCRRCGSAFTHAEDFVYHCPNGHVIYANPAPAAAMLLEDSQGRAVVITRAIDPGKGMYDLPGGFCDGADTLEQAAMREIEEEIGLKPEHYSEPVLLNSSIDLYEFKGECVTVLAAIFYAKLHDGAPLKAGDDAAAIQMLPLNQELVEKLAFPSKRNAVQKLLNQR